MRNVELAWKLSVDNAKGNLKDFHNQIFVPGGFMRSIMISALACFALVAFVLFGCESGPNQPGKPGSVFSSGGNQYNFVAPGTHYNVDNPYDSVGILHNEALAYTLNQVLGMFDDMDSTNVADTIKLGVMDYFINAGLCEFSELDAILDEAATDYENQNGIDPSVWFTTLTGPELTAKELHYLHAIGTVFGMGLDDSTVILDSIFAIEERILNENWAIDDHETAALTTVSVWKHSFLFWNKVGSDIIDGGGEPQDWSPVVMAFPATMDTEACTFEYTKNGKRYIGMAYRAPASTVWSACTFYSRKWQQFKNWLSGD